MTFLTKHLQFSFLFRLIQVAAVAVFFGRAWQHLFWDAPFRTLLWDEALLSDIVYFPFGMEWEAYITNPSIEKKMEQLIRGFGGFYALVGLTATFVRCLPRFFHHLLWIGSLGLAFLAFLYTKEKFYNVGQFFEYSLQIGSPVLLWHLARQATTYSFSARFLLLLKVLTALTFTCHGLYAVGYYPIPAYFIEMTMNILGTSESTARQFLLVVGWLDFALSVGIFLPWKYARFFLAYAVFWGFGTTIARIWANFNWEWLDYVLWQWLHESVMRMPHFLIPLAVFFYYWKKEKTIHPA
ncbi:MAG: hypothetical protein AAF960_19915 [Bacteroidota bacterium]